MDQGAKLPFLDIPTFEHHLSLPSSDKSSSRQRLHVANQHCYKHNVKSSSPRVSSKGNKGTAILSSINVNVNKHDSRRDLLETNEKPVCEHGSSSYRCFYHVTNWSMHETTPNFPRQCCFLHRSQNLRRMICDVNNRLYDSYRSDATPLSGFSCRDIRTCHFAGPSHTNNSLQGDFSFSLLCEFQRRGSTQHKANRTKTNKRRRLELRDKAALLETPFSLSDNLRTRWSSHSFRQDTDPTSTPSSCSTRGEIQSPASASTQITHPGFREFPQPGKVHRTVSNVFLKLDSNENAVFGKYYNAGDGRKVMEKSSGVDPPRLALKLGLLRQLRHSMNVHADKSSTIPSSAAVDDEELFSDVKSTFTDVRPNKQTASVVEISETKIALKLVAPLVIMEIIILCAGWISSKGTYLRRAEAVDWVGISLWTLLIQLALVEPLIFVGLSLISFKIAPNPIIFSDYGERLAGWDAEVSLRESMVPFVRDHLTFPTYQQALPKSAKLYSLHLLTYKALWMIKNVPKVVFNTGVKWLLVYTVFAVIVVVFHSDISTAYRERETMYKTLGLSDNKSHVTVDQMWIYLDKLLHTVMSEMHHLNWQTRKTTNTSAFLVTPARLRQYRVNPENTDTDCFYMPRLRIDPRCRCNVKFSKDNMETRNFSDGWDSLVKFLDDDDNAFVYVKHDEPPLKADYLPNSGYEKILRTDSYYVGYLNKSGWIDENTRVITLEFTILNLASFIISAFKIRFDYNNYAPTKSVISYHFFSPQIGDYRFYLTALSILFVLFSAYNLIKEALVFYKCGLRPYLLRLYTYMELGKLFLSILLCSALFKRPDLSEEHLRDLAFSYNSLSGVDGFYLDFLKIGILDRVFVGSGGFLILLCTIEIIQMVSQIPRLVVFTRMLKSSGRLLYLPVFVTVAFSYQSHLLFGRTIEKFEDITLSFQAVSQEFIKPQKTYHRLVADHPYMGKVFFLLMASVINIFTFNIFIAFVNEIYSDIKRKVRFKTYHIKEKSTLEYFYDFFGIENRGGKAVADDDEQDPELIAQERGFLREIKVINTV